MERISTSSIVLMGVQRVVCLLSVMQEDPILVTSGLDYLLVLSAESLSPYYQVCTYVATYVCSYVYMYVDSFLSFSSIVNKVKYSANGSINFCLYTFCNYVSYISTLHTIQ